jgi:hypothetical protein
MKEAHKLPIKITISVVLEDGTIHGTIHNISPTFNLVTPPETATESSELKLMIDHTRDQLVSAMLQEGTLNS